MFNRRIRVIQYGLGPIGASIVRLMLEKPCLDIAGAVDIDPEKAGKDLGAVAGAGRDLGVVVSADARSLLRGGADVVVHSTGSHLEQVATQLLQCLEAGTHVVSTCEELAYPFRKHPELSQRLDRCAKQNRVALLGTGVNPGFVLDKLLLTLSAVSQRVDSAKGLRIVDASKRRLPLQKKIGAGMSVEEFRRQVAAGVIKHHGLPESVAMVADGLGLAIDDIVETIEPVVASKTVRTEFLEVALGQAAGVHQVALGLAGGRPKIRLELQMYVGAGDPGDTLELTGEPNIRLTVPGGTHGDIATAAVVVNCIPALLEARPGLRTSRDIPMHYFSGCAAAPAALPREFFAREMSPAEREEREDWLKMSRETQKGDR
jgi:4-hydroxy-tetrahydrodipicolinate reductase